MERFDEELRVLGQQRARKQHLKSMLPELKKCKAELVDRVCALRSDMIAEQSDVARLEGRSLAAFFYQVVGKLDEKLDLERQEAYAAKVKYDAAARELEAVEEDLRQISEELFSLRDCEELYARRLAEKAAAIKASGGQAAEKLLRLEERITDLKNRGKELREAVSAGNSALDAATGILESLRSAGNWAALDLFGGGAITDLAKHNHLDEAQEKVERLQIQLRRFKTELTDVSVSADIQIGIDSFLRFADYFFDGLFADWTVMDKIDRAQTQVNATVCQLRNVLRKLNDMLAATEEYEAETKDEMDGLVLETKNT